MHFDDRLATVLRLPASTGAIARIQFRQLIDILGQHSAPSSPSDVMVAAMAKLEDLAVHIPASERAALLSEPTTRIANPDLVAKLAHCEPEVAIAAIQSSDLAESDWLKLIPSLEVRARGILRHRNDLGLKVDTLLEQLGINDRGLPPASSPQPVADRPTRPELVVLEGGASSPSPRRHREEPSIAGIGAIVRKIEAFRTARTGDNDTNPDGASASQVSAASCAVIQTIDFTTDDKGRVNWADGPFSSALVGFLLIGESNAPLRQPFRLHQPLRDTMIEVAGAPVIAGHWRLDALPQFGGSDSRFWGYSGRLRRPPTSTMPEAKSVQPADSMREILHELRTPANAIQVAAEIIQQQLHGPVPHEYRALAASIAGDTAHVLAGFDEMDRLVRMESGVISTVGGECDIGPIIVETVSRLRAWTTPRGSDFRLPHAPLNYNVGIEKDEAARLVWRLFAAIAGASSSGEFIEIDLKPGAEEVILIINIPPTLTTRLQEASQAGRPPALAKSLSAGTFGVSFTLRLAAAEARAGGGQLEQEDTRITLRLPKANIVQGANRLFSEL